MTAHLLNGLRSGIWLTPPRMVAYPRLLVAACVILILVGLLTATGPRDALRRPLGTSFTQVWAAEVSVLDKHSENPFDPALLAPYEARLWNNSARR